MNGLYRYVPDMLPIFGLMFFKSPSSADLWSQTAFVSAACSIRFLRRQTVPSTFQLYGYRWISLKKRPDRPVGRWYKTDQ